MFEGCILLLTLVGGIVAPDALDSTTTELAKVLKKSKYFLAKLEMVADELRTSTEVLVDGIQNFSYLPEECKAGGGMIFDGVGNGTDYDIGAGMEVLPYSLKQCSYIL